MTKNIEAIRVNLNDMKYRYDIFLMINLYFSFINIEFVEDKYDIAIEINDKSIDIKGIYNDFQYSINENYKMSEEVKKAVFNYLKEGTGKVLPWGTLVGIRPSKKALSYLESGYNEEEIIREFQDRHETLEEKTKLCIDVAKYEKNVVNTDKNSISIYVGMPFCPTRCVYCSFTSNPVGANKNNVINYLNSLTKEIEEISKYVDEKKLRIETVYFGGGTPTSVNDDQFEDIMGKIYNNFVKDRDVKEFTVECGRVDSITRNKLLSMRRYNVDRISINPQTMNDDTLKVIGRNHNSEAVEECFNMARELGFDNINMDLIVGLPGENLNHIVNSCERIAKLNPDNLTIHGLSVKRGSRLHENLINNKTYVVPDQDELNSMYETTKLLSEKLNMKP